MTNPFKYQPQEADHENPDEPSPDEWANNWLSNFMAWFSHRFLGPWCSTEGHWTSRVTQFLFTSCPCCLLWRGFTLGAIVGAVGGTAILQIFALLL